MNHLLFAWASRGGWGGALLLLWGLGVVPAQAQHTVQVLTRTVEQRFACPVGTLVRIRAEKATLRVQGWDQPTVKVTLQLSARHPDRAVAEQELPRARYQLEQHGSAIDLVNYFVLPAGGPALRSDLRAEYTVFMPTANAVQIVNTYGKTVLLDLSGRQQLEQDFGQIDLQNLTGRLTATVRYADVTGTNIHGVLDCEADKSALRLTGAGGRCTIRNHYGSVQLEPAADLQSVVVDAERTEVRVGVGQLARFNYQFSTAQGQLVVPASLAGGVRTRTGRQLLEVSNQPHLPLIRVVTSYAPITLQLISPLLIQR